MIINDKEIETACKEVTPLIDDYEAALISNCTYAFRIGHLFEPNSGNEIVLSTAATLPSDRRRHTMILGSNEIALIVTKETINMPDHLMATYSPLNSLARQGLMLLNASVIEPGYRGPLSCILVNMSSQSVCLTIGQRITKAVFYKLSAAPTAPKRLNIDREEYLQSMARSAVRYHRSFLNIEGVVEKAKVAATSAAKQGVVFGGIFLAVLLAFSQMEPFMTKWLREKAGIASASTVLEIQMRELELEKLRIELERRFSQLNQKIDALEESKPGKPSQ